MLQSFLPRTSLRSDCRPGLALLAQLASQAVVGFTLEEVKGRAFRSYEVSLVHHAYQVDGVLLGSGEKQSRTLVVEQNESWR